MKAIDLRPGMMFKGSGQYIELVLGTVINGMDVIVYLLCISQYRRDIVSTSTYAKSDMYILWSRIDE